MTRVIFICLFLLFGQMSKSQSNDSVGVIRAIEKLQIALTKPDPQVLAKLFTEDGDFTNVIDSTIHGRKDIYAHHYNLWVVQRRPATRTVNVLAYHIRFVKPDVAAVEVRWDNIHTKGPDGTTLPNRDGVWVCVMTKESGEWYMKVARNLFLHDGTPGHELKRLP